MLEYLKQLDIQLLLAVNGIHTPFLDECMLVVTSRFTWIPFYILIVAFLFWKRKNDFFLVLLFVILTVVCSDLFASSFMKPLFQRLRPCHDPTVNSFLYMLKDSCGGRYGFVSSHAANTFGLIMFLFLLFKNEFRWIVFFFFWAALVSLSRVYLGVHYPFDILVGGLSGIFIATGFYALYRFCVRKNIFVQSDLIVKK